MFIQQKIASAAIDNCRSKKLVASGPFKGTPATLDALEHDWGRLLGIYEIWLQPAVSEVLRSNPNVIVDVGASTGCYSIGFANAFPNSKHIAFEMNESEREKFKKIASKISTPIHLRGFCSSDELLQITQKFPKGFLMMDCEGYERELLNEKVHDKLKNWSILVEIHDWHAPGVGEEIQKRFSNTHAISEIWNRPYTPKDFSFLLTFPLNYLCFGVLARMCDDQRNSKMRWFYMVPLSNSYGKAMNE